MNKLIIFLFVSSVSYGYGYDVPNVDEETKILSSAEVAPILIDRSFNRPASCPLKSNTYSDIRKKFIKLHTLLKNGQCAKQNPGILESMNTILKSGIMSRMYPLGSVPATSTHSPTEILQVLEGLTKVEQCVEDIKQGGLLTELADISVTLGQMAFILPNLNGVVAGVLGLGLGTAIRVVQNIFKKTFDWSEPSDREQFLNLNCSFFDMRREIEATQFLLPVDPSLPGQISFVENGLKKVSGKSVTIKNRILKYIEAIKKDKDLYVYYSEENKRDTAY